MGQVAHFFNYSLNTSLLEFSNTVLDELWSFLEEENIKYLGCVFFFKKKRTQTTCGVYKDAKICGACLFRYS